MEKKIRPLRAHGIHDRERSISLPGIAAETKRHLSIIFEFWSRDKTRDRASLFAGNRGAVIITGRRLRRSMKWAEVGGAVDPKNDVTILAEGSPPRSATCSPDRRAARSSRQRRSPPDT
jgi:hypothetical protein